MALGGGRAWRGDNATNWLLEVFPALALFLVTSPTSPMQPKPFQLLSIVDGFAYILSPSWSFKQSPENLVVSSTAPNTSGFYRQKLWGFILLVLEPWTVWSGLGLGLFVPKYPSRFLSTTCECGTVCSTAAATSLHYTLSPCLSAHLCDSTPPTCLDESGFFKALVIRLPYNSVF